MECYQNIVGFETHLEANISVWSWEQGTVHAPNCSFMLCLQAHITSLHHKVTVWKEQQTHKW